MDIETSPDRIEVPASYEARIREVRSGFSPSFARLADFLLDSYAQASFLTATELAHTLDIDPATVVRFAQKLGYPGYPELQREIRCRVRSELLSERQPSDPARVETTQAALADVIQSLDLTRRSLHVQAAQSLIHELDHSERVVILAEGLAAAPAHTLAGWLEAAGYTIHPAGGGLPDLARAVASARKGDLVLAVEVVEETPFVARALGEARAAGVRTAAMVCAPSSQVARHADLVLSAYANPDPGVGLIIMEAIIYALSRLLVLTRPGLFGPARQRVSDLARRLTEPSR